MGSGETNLVKQQVAAHWGRQLKAQKARAAARIERVERAVSRQDEIEDAVPGGALGGGADAVAKAGVKPGRAPAPMGGDLRFDQIGPV